LAGSDSVSRLSLVGLVTDIKGLIGWARGSLEAALKVGIVASASCQGEGQFERPDSMVSAGGRWPEAVGLM
jgi:hypothetical protein